MNKNNICVTYQKSGFVQGTEPQVLSLKFKISLVWKQMNLMIVTSAIFIHSKVQKKYCHMMFLSIHTYTPVI